LGRARDALREAHNTIVFHLLDAQGPMLGPRNRRIWDLPIGGKADTTSALFAHMHAVLRLMLCEARDPRLRSVAS
jgi:hypothetical protein